ncbi:MAG: hypothetical protein Kow0020_03210 [Wenzhouxiangellaceae bacterium]
MIAATGAAQAELDTTEALFPIPPHRAIYEVKRGDKTIGRVTATLTALPDGLWEYRIDSEATVWYLKMLDVGAEEWVRFGWRDGRIQPQRYHHRSREPGRDRYWDHEFDWAAGISRTRTHEGPMEIPITTGVLDPLSLRLAASLAIRNATLSGPEPFAGFEAPVLERSRVETQRYFRTGAEPVRIDRRCYRTEVYRRERKPGSARNYDAWHAPLLGGLPVRVRHFEQNRPITLELTALESEALTLPASGPCASTDATD